MTLELDNLTPREVELVKWLAERTKERDAAQAALAAAQNTIVSLTQELARLRSPAATPADSELLAALEQVIPHTWRQMSDFDSVLHDIGIFVRDRDAALKDSETKPNA